MLEIVESRNGYIVLVPCPHCGQYSEEDFQILFAAYVDNAPLRHLDCGKDFYVELSCLTRVVEQRDAAAASEQKCPDCDGEGTGFSEGESWTCSMCNGTGISNRSERS